jgi:SAM-dependent methyltransferase
LLEFTGERVVPGLVDADLFNEHRARYRFAAHFAASLPNAARILDAGCGSGYGTAEFIHAGCVVGIDQSADAVKYAADAFGRPGIHFLQAGCESLPFADGVFDLVAAFEVIEHLARWREMLSETRRVLTASGILLVSTPNKSYYAESRAAAGPNPYHEHEFEFAEFSQALGEFFPHVRLWGQNHTEAIAFVPENASQGVLDAPGRSALEDAHFYFAACSMSPIAWTGAYAHLNAAGNILRERERHIALLESELAQKDTWLKRLEAEHAELHQHHHDALAELQQANEWAGRLDQDMVRAGTRITELQKELDSAHAGYQDRIAILDREAARRLAWVHDLEGQIQDGRNEIARLEGEMQRMNQELWRVNEDATKYEAALRAVGDSKWVRLGRKLHVGPVISHDVNGG